MKTYGNARRAPIPPTCDEELIQFLGAIQPDGFLVSVADDWVVLRCSENIEAIIGVELRHAIGQPLRDLIDRDLLHDIRGCLQTAGGDGVVARLFRRRIVAEGPAFDIAAHRSDREFVIEFERSVGASNGSLSDLRSMIANVERQGSAQNLLLMAARHLRAFTGYDRVMVYRFEDDGTGEVVAESAQGDMTPFLGLRYPASDIPRQARALYERSYLRTITDADAAPVAIVSAPAARGRALDLSMSALRSVSPVHLEYLRNMGVRASMSVSILRGGQLWGLFACHHRQPRRIGYEMRSAVELFGQMFSYLLEEHEREDDAVFDAFVLETQEKLLATVVGSKAIPDRLPAMLATIGELIPCDGAAYFTGDEVTLAGEAPSRNTAFALKAFLDASGRTTFATHAIAETIAPAAALTHRCAGLLAMKIATTSQAYLVLFRHELVKSVLWAGEPGKAVTSSADGPRLSPRLSFEAWRETVRNQSARWTRRELRAADALRTTLVELALSASDSAHHQRTGDGQRQEILIAELNHRVRNILGLVRGLVTGSAASAPDVRALVDSLDDRIRSLASAHDILTMSDWKPSSLHALLRAEIGTYSRSEDNLVLSGPDVLLQPQAYTAMAMVIHELVTNARKHGSLSRPDGRITVDTATDVTGGVSIAWRETGGPPVHAPTRRGFGSTILEQAIPFDCNGTSVPSYHPSGFRLSLTLPAASATCVAAFPATRSHEDPRDVESAKLGSILQKTLIVEDNLFIALDAEDMMRTLGSGTIEVVKTVAEALDAITRRPFSFALLDVNLGAQTSLPVALALREAGIPFVFATGYRQALGMPASLSDVPIVSKPYNRHAMGQAIVQILSPAGPRNAPVLPTPGVMRTVPASGLHDVDRSASLIAVATRSVHPGAGPDVLTRRLSGLVALSPADKAALATVAAHAKAAARKTDIVSEGSCPNGLYIVLAGFACRFRLRRDGSRQITSLLLPGDVCDLSDVDRMKDVLGTLSDCRLATMTRDEALALKATYPAIATALLRLIHIEQAISREWLANVGRSSEERFAHLFCELLTRLQGVGLVEHDEFKMPLTQFDLGDTLGFSYVHVSRTLQTLRQRGYLSLKGKVVCISNLPRLKALADFDPKYLSFGLR